MVSRCGCSQLSILVPPPGLPLKGTHMSNKKNVKLFPDVKTLFADEMTNAVAEGLGTEIRAHYEAAKKNGIPAQVTAVSALDALAKVSGELLSRVVPPARWPQAVADFSEQVEKHLREREGKEGTAN